MPNKSDSSVIPDRQIPDPRIYSVHAVILVCVVCMFLLCAGCASTPPGSGARTPTPGQTPVVTSKQTPVATPVPPVVVTATPTIAPSSSAEQDLMALITGSPARPDVLDPKIRKLPFDLLAAKSMKDTMELTGYLNLALAPSSMSGALVFSPVVAAQAADQLNFVTDHYWDIFTQYRTTDPAETRKLVEYTKLFYNIKMATSEISQGLAAESSGEYSTAIIHMDNAIFYLNRIKTGPDLPPTSLYSTTLAHIEYYKHRLEREAKLAQVRSIYGM